jgi:uncharacterized protein (DUF58 family)
MPKLHLPSSNPPSALLPPELLSRLERLELVTRKVFQGRLKGERRSRRKGQSVEFADFRNYVSGDDLRFIDWNLYARLDRLFLKLFLEEEDLHFHTLIDCSASMQFGNPTKFFVAKQLAAALGYVGLCRTDRVRIAGLGPTGSHAPVLRGRSSMWRMLAYLDSLEANSNVSLAQGVKEFCLRSGGNGIVLLITDLMDKQGYESALRMLVGRRLDIYLIHILSPEEVSPNLVGDLKLIDCEDDAATEVTVSRFLLNRYEQSLTNFVEQAKRFCSQRGITYMRIQSDEPVDRLVTSYLRQHGVLR